MTNPASSLKVIKPGRLVDGRGGPSKQGLAVVVENDVITNVGPLSELSSFEERATDVIDLPDTTLLPGLIDCHTHTNMPGTGQSVDQVHEDNDDIHLLHAVKSSRMALESGVTTMRDNGGWHGVVFSVKEGIRRGIVPGPRIVACGRPITITGGHCWMMGSEADGIDQVRSAVRQLIKEGADFIKVMASGGTTRGSMRQRASYTQSELQAAVEEAHHRGKLVAGHAIATDAIVNCLDTSVDMIIHCSFVSTDDTVQYDPEVADRIAESGAWINPTLHVVKSTVLALEEKRRNAGLQPEEEIALEERKRYLEATTENTGRMISQGARFIGGSDCGWADYPFAQFHAELKALVDAGLSHSQAIVAGTRDAADAVGILNEVGTVEPGKQADLLLVKGDPTRDIEDLANVVAVFQAGARVV